MLCCNKSSFRTARKFRVASNRASRLAGHEGLGGAELTHTHTRESSDFSNTVAEALKSCILPTTPYHHSFLPFPPDLFPPFSSYTSIVPLALCIFHSSIFFLSFSVNHISLLRAQRGSPTWPCPNSLGTMKLLDSI